MPEPDHITLRSLAKELGVSWDDLPPLISAGYLKPAKKQMFYFDGDLVRIPPPAAIRWLQVMLQPAKWKDMVPVDMAAKELKLSIDRLRGYCLTFDIQLYRYPIFGEMMTFQGFKDLRKELDEESAVVRTDRQMFAFLLIDESQLGAGEQLRRKLTPRKFSKRIEREIERIIALPDPQRSLAAAKLWKSFVDAEVFAGAVKGVAKIDAGPLVDEMRQKMDSIGKVLRGKRSWSKCLTPTKKTNGAVAGDGLSSDA